MRRHLFWIGVCAVSALLTAAGKETQTNATLRLTIDLVDGSRLIGTPVIATVPVQTSYAKMDVPLTQIQALKIGDDHETVTLNLRNGDKLTGVISLKPIELKTVFGTVAVGIEHIKQLDIVLSGGTNQKGLVLWNRLGSESEVKNSRVGLGGKRDAGRFAEGRFGQGIELNMKEPFGVTFPAEIVPASAGCIEFWAKLVGFPANITQGYHPSLIRSDTPEGSGFHLFFAPNDGAANGGLCIKSRLGWAGTGPFGSWSYAGSLKSDKAGDWHHYAIVWNGVGNIPNVADTTRKISVFVDGQLNTTTSNKSPEDQLFMPGNAPRFGFIGFPTDAIPGASIVFDNLKIWNYAKTDFNDRDNEKTNTQAEGSTMITMNSRKHVLAVGMIVALAVSTWGEETQTNATLRLAIDLIDGSRLIGTPGIATVPVQTSYAKMDVPLKQIQALKIGDDHETVTLNLRNGDKLTGVISLAPIKLETLFGPASIGIEHIKQLRVTLGGSDPGLILWNKMGSIDEIQNSAVGPKGNIQGAIDAYAPGVFGNAAHLRGSAGEVYFDIPYLENKHLGTDPFTFAFWAKSDTVNQPEGFIIDAYSQGTMMIRLVQYNPSTLRVVGFPEMKHRWDTEYHHYAIVFEANGRSTFYIDADVKARSDNTESIGQAFSPRIVLSGEWNLTDGYDWKGYIDNVKAWNYAKTDFKDRTDE